MSVDTDTLVTLTVQIDALQQQLAAATDPAVKSYLTAQIAVLSAQLKATAQHAQSQSDASSNMLNALGLFGTLSNTVGTLAPSILGLFKK